MIASTSPRIGTGPRARMQPPSSTPAVEDAARREWAAGWWAGIAVGLVNGVALAVAIVSSGWLR